jgi:hypothetical protein
MPLIKLALDNKKPTLNLSSKKSNSGRPYPEVKDEEETDGFQQRAMEEFTLCQRSSTRIIREADMNPDSPHTLDLGASPMRTDQEMFMEIRVSNQSNGQKNQLNFGGNQESKSNSPVGRKGKGV